MRVLYDPLISKKGALLSAAKAPKRAKDPSDYAAVGEIFSPLALPMYREDRQDEKERKRRLELKDPYVAKIPEKPVTSGPGNRPNTNFFYTNYVMKDRQVDKNRIEDPREAMLSVAAEVEQAPSAFARAYAHSQPTKQLHTQTYEQEQEEFRKRQRKF